MPSATLAQLAFLLHAAVETPAAVTFVFMPERQLSSDLVASQVGKGSGTEVTLLLHNLGGLLASSVALSLVMAIWACTSASNSTLPGATSIGISAPLRGGIALALGGYHLFPCRRAYLRRKYSIGTSGRHRKTLGGPSVHLIVHIVCFVALLSAAMVDFDIL
ncbi:hypothetical protein SEPCBS57363_000209 [Sporothrix epigloea]|uniref:Uncharacterized protein n=1 Tax=Sporothrix epigloea TaxID=1892477 RepID=A0ABP0D3G6_9PEZI